MFSCRWYPVVSRSVQPVIFADLHVVLRFEPVDGKGLVYGSKGLISSCNWAYEKKRESF